MRRYTMPTAVMKATMMYLRGKERGGRLDFIHVVLGGEQSNVVLVPGRYRALSLSRKGLIVKLHVVSVLIFVTLSLKSLKWFWIYSSA